MCGRHLQFELMCKCCILLACSPASQGTSQAKPRHWIKTPYRSSCQVTGVHIYKHIHLGLPVLCLDVFIFAEEKSWSLLLAYIHTADRVYWHRWHCLQDAPYKFLSLFGLGSHILQCLLTFVSATKLDWYVSDEPPESPLGDWGCYNFLALPEIIFNLLRTN